MCYRFPQVYIDGEFYGGCDIVIEAFQNGELQETLERVLNE
jgi:monothiol glutaredoxin